MGEHVGGSPMGSGGLSPNGLLPNAGPLMECLDSERWLKAEERTAELISCIQPNQPSEERRNAVADYVQCLIMKCFPCQVFTFGSVPLKTYLPDGDIDLTAFSNNPNLKDSWASEVRDMLETEEKNENAEFHVKEVQYIQAEVKIIKCLVENIVVDISFNQLGGLCTLCFLEEVDNLINQNHLFKRSIILIKAWCYYESRILGAHHGLISTYALETLVLYIFHVFNNAFAGPLEVLYRFLEFFSNFDWDNFCVSLWGPVPISSLPDVTAEPPRKDSGELLLNKVFLDACSSVYAVFPGGQDNQAQTFLSKHFNVIDPLRVSNNLGRSVSKGNFFRIRSAFAFGAKKLARLLDCPKENLVAEVNQFFTNTWDRHGNGIRPDAPDVDSYPLHSSTTDNHNTKSTESFGRGSEFDDNSSRVSSDRHPESQKSYANSNSSRTSQNVRSDNRVKNLKLNHLVNEIHRSPFARTRSSPELTDTYKDGHRGTSKNGTNTSKNDPGEEQDLVNMMASSSALQGIGSHVHMPMNLPFPISPSFLASMAYPQRNSAEMFPTNVPLIDSSFPGVPFSHGFVSPQPPQYFSSNNEDLFDPGNENTSPVETNSEILVSDDKPQWSSTGRNYVPPPRRAGGSGGGLTRNQPKHNKERRGSSRNDPSDHFQHDDRANEAYNDEQTSGSRFSYAARRTFSESSWDEPLTSSKSTKEKRGKKAVGMSECSSMDDEPAQTSGSDTVVSVAPVVLGSNSRQKTMDDSGSLPLTFYPTGPPVPFLTMLPFYNVESDTGPSTSHFTAEESFDKGEIGRNHRLERLNPADDFVPSNEYKSDILNSDFASHWQNLQFGRFCQTPPPAVYPSPAMVPPVYLQGRVPWDGPGRPVSKITQLMSYGPRLVPFQSASNRPPNVYQRYVEDLPRYRSGTGTYLPTPKVSPKDLRHSSGSRRGSYNHDRSDNHVDREGNNWNANSKTRRNHNHNRTQTDRPSSRSGAGAGAGEAQAQADQSMGSYKPDPFPTYQPQNGPTGVAYGMYPLPTSVPGALAPNGSTVVMVYPYDNNAGGFGDHVEFGSAGPAGFPGLTDQSQRATLEEHRFYGSSPDPPSLPHHQRRV